MSMSRKEEDCRSGKGYEDRDLVVPQHFQAGLGHLGVHLVAHATRKEGHLDAASKSGLVQRAIADVQEPRCQRMDMPITQPRLLSALPGKEKMLSCHN